MAKPQTIFDKPVIILPFYGEFGFFVPWYVRWVNAIEAPQKIVCCERGEEIYLPSASDFYYDWENPVEDKRRKGYRDYENSDKLRLKKVFAEKYPNHTVVDLVAYPPYLLMKDDLIEIKPKKTIGLKCDVVLGARYRAKAQDKNWPYWNELGEMLSADGVSYAVIGKKETTTAVRGACYYSWDYPSPDSVIELLQSSKVFAGTCTGTAWLAAHIGIPMVVLSPWPRGTSPYLKKFGEAHSKKFTLLPDDTAPKWSSASWTNPKYFYKKIIENL